MVSFFCPNRRRHTRSSTVSWARRCVEETDGELIEAETAKLLGFAVGQLSDGWGEGFEPVAYTHLTLPTIYSV